MKNVQALENGWDAGAPCVLCRPYMQVNLHGISKMGFYYIIYVPESVDQPRVEGCV